MPRSRAPTPRSSEASASPMPASSPASSPASPNHTNSNDSQADEGGCLSPHQYHPGLTLPSPKHHTSAWSPGQYASSSTSAGGTSKKFKYVKPRIGNYFQAKVGKFDNQKKNTTDTRDLDDLTTSTHSVNLIAGGSSGPGRKRKAGRPPKGSKLKVPDPNEPLTYDPTLQPQRGGICIHRPDNYRRLLPIKSKLTSGSRNMTTAKPQSDCDEYLTFCRNLQYQTPRDKSHNIARADHLWNQALQENMYQLLDKKSKDKNKHAKSRGKKRKLESDRVKNDSDGVQEVASAGDNPVDTVIKKDVDTDVDIASLTTTSENDTNSNVGTDIEMDVTTNNWKINAITHKDIALGMEGDDCILEYLQRRGSGQMRRAQFLTLVEFCRGKAVKTRRRIQKERKQDGMTVPLSAVFAPMSDSWRRRYERLNVAPTILGDHRRKPGDCAYPYFSVGSQKDRNEEGMDSAASTASNIFPWKRKWDQDVKVSRCDDIYSGSNTRSSPLSTNWDEYDVAGNRDLMESWTSVLERGQIIVENYKNGHKPVFADLFILLKKAHSIPIPEDIYERRDTMPKQVSQCLNSILDLVENGRDVLAHIMDAFYCESDDGIELKALSDTLNAKTNTCDVQLKEMEIAREILDECLEWQSKLQLAKRGGEGESSSSEDLRLPQQSLASAEGLVRQGRELPLRPDSLVVLEDRIHRAYELRNRIRSWNRNNGDDKDSVKYIAAMIKEANKIDLSFTELSLLSRVHRDAEKWMDRANVALRSKISLNELESLVITGEKMPLGLTGALEKLQKRYKDACDWISRLKEEVPCPLESMSVSGCGLDAGNRSEWLLKMREALKNGNDDKVSALTDLSSQGSRLPVEIDFLQLLQTAIDARNWSLKAKRWVPSAGDQFKRGKFEDLSEHLDGATAIVDRAKQLTNDKADWELDFADELRCTVDKANEWFKVNHKYLTGDNRKANSRTSLSYTKLRSIVDDAERIPTNLGNKFAKINRIHNEAKTWMEKNKLFLQRCGIHLDSSEETGHMKPVSIDEVNSAIESAGKEIAVDLDELQKLKTMAGESQDWFRQVLEIAPKRNKRVVGSKKGCQDKFSLETVISLIESASKIPMDTNAEVERLGLLLSDVKSWRLATQMRVKEISSLIGVLLKERERFYGKPHQFLDTCVHEKMNVEKEKDVNMNCEPPIQLKANEKCTPHNSSVIKPKGDGRDVYKMVENLARSTESVYVLTFEEEIVKQLETIMKWCKKCARIIDSHEDVFIEKRWKKDLNALIKSSADMNFSDEKFSVPMPADDSEEKEVLSNIVNSVSELISSDLKRLEILKNKRDKYYAWSDKAIEMYIDSSKRVPLETLTSLANECSIYPSTAETVKRISKDASAAAAWVTEVKELLDAGKKLTLEEVKSKMNKIARVKITTPEYEKLRKAHQNAKNWASRVKKNITHDGSAQIHVLKELLREHDDLIIAVPEEVQELKQILCGYCICRRPYEGFMIGCDDCNEWYHGPCIGVTQAQGDRMDKYVCVRCCVKRVYKISCNKVTSIVRKWCDKKDLSKARSSDNQKHQRKVREKKREITKWQEECKAGVLKLQQVEARKESLRHQSVAVQDPNVSGEIDVSVTAQQLQEEEASATASITKATHALEQANLKLAEFTRIHNERKATQNRENQLHPCFRYWAIMIRCTVLAPDTLELAEKSRPVPTQKCKTPNELLSEPMHRVLEATKDLGIIDFPDIAIVKDAFQCIGWCCLAFDVIMKKPKIEELRCLVKLSDIVKLPEVKSVGMIKGLISRASAWRAKVNKVLTPNANESKPFNAALMKDLVMGMSAIPVTTPEESILCNAVTDEGQRHCICGGPRDDKTMTCCVSCNKCYHHNCINVLSAVDPERWLCPFCEQRGISVENKKVKSRPTPTSTLWPFLEADGDISPHAPVAKQMWPPFGLANSPEAMGALGSAWNLNIGNEQRPTPRKSESTAEIVKKAVTFTSLSTSNSATNNPNHTTTQHPRQPLRIQLKKKSKADVSHQNLNAINLNGKPQRKAGSESSVSVLASRFPSFAGNNAKNTPNSSLSLSGAGAGNPHSNLNGTTNQNSLHNTGIPLTNGVISNLITKTPIQASSSFQAASSNKPSIASSFNAAIAKTASISSDGSETPFVEGLTNGIVQDALLVATNVAKSVPIVLDTATVVKRTTQALPGPPSDHSNNVAKLDIPLSIPQAPKSAKVKGIKPKNGHSNPGTEFIGKIPSIVPTTNHVGKSHPSKPDAPAVATVTTISTSNVFPAATVQLNSIIKDIPMTAVSNELTYFPGGNVSRIVQDVGAQSSTNIATGHELASGSAEASNFKRDSQQN